MGDIIKGLIGLLAVLAIYIGIPLTLFAGWVNHIIICIQSEQWMLLLAGAILFPVGIVHGIGAWFGLF